MERWTNLHCVNFVHTNRVQTIARKIEQNAAAAPMWRKRNTWLDTQSLDRWQCPDEWTECVGLLLKVYMQTISHLQLSLSYKIHRSSLKTIHYLFTNSFSTRLNITFRRSCRFERMFFEILFWCRVLFSHATPMDTRTWQPFSLEGKSSTWYLRWSFKKMKENSQLKHTTNRK